MGAKYEVIVRTKVDDSIQKFGLVYDQTAGSTGSDSTQELIDAWEDTCLAPLTLILATDTEILSIYGRKLDGESRPTWRKNLIDTVGLRTGTSISAQNCLIFNLRNLGGGLKRPGRLFISGCAKEDIAQAGALAGGWDAALLNPPASNFAAAIIEIDGTTGSNFEGELQVRQYIQNTPDPPDYTYVQVDSVDATVEPGSRMARKGRDTALTD